MFIDRDELKRLRQRYNLQMEKSGIKTFREITRIESEALESEHLNRSLTNYTITNEPYLDFAFQLGTTDSGTTPYVDQITLNYDEVGMYRTNLSTDYQIDFISSTQTKVTKLSSGTKNIKVNVLV